MIGNDVVDLVQARMDSNWRRKGWLQKIFTQKELRFIANAECQDTEVWTLWSKKEAAYKIWNRAMGLRRFNPIRFECQNAGLLPDMVRFENLVYYVQTNIIGDCIHSIAVSDRSSLNDIVTGDYSKLMKIGTVPFLIGQNSNVPCSVSHHGRFQSVVSLRVT